MAIKFSLNTTKGFLVPNVKKLVDFSNGDLGIADAVKISTIIKNSSKLKDEESLAKFKELMHFDLSKSDKEYFKNNKCVINKSDVQLKHDDDLSGLKACEKALIQSIFESQKPYAEVFTQTVGCLVKIEDIIAQVLSSGGRSLKPKFNPKALGYKPDTPPEINVALSKMKSLMGKKRGGGLTQSLNVNKDATTNSNTSGSFEYQILSTEYSTGEYDPNVNYNYEYIDIMDSNFNDSMLSTGTNISDESEDKPKVIVLGIFDDKGNPLNEIPDWLEKSGKWYGQFDLFTDFGYVWFNILTKDKFISFSPPGRSGWIKLKNGDDPIIIQKKGSVKYFKEYFNDVTMQGLNGTDMTSKEKKDIVSNINKTLNYKEYANTIIKSGFLPTSGQYPLKSAPFKPKKIKYKSKDIWIDPENEYDMKIIKIIPDKNVDKIKNKLLSVNTSYSKKEYGSSTVSFIQKMDTISRYVSTEDDTNTYYIVEGILGTLNDHSSPASEDGKTLGGKESGDKYYKLPKGPIGSISSFAKLIVDIFSKLIPSITKLQNLLSNPASFVVDEVLLKKLGDNDGKEDIKYDIFSKSFKKDFDKLTNMDPKKRKSFVKNNPRLGKYVHIDDDGNIKFVLDGSSLVNFLGSNFGIGMNMLTPKLKSASKNSSKNKSQLSNESQNKNQYSETSNKNLTPRPDVSSNQIISNANGLSTTEEVSIQYSTGEFKEGVKYEYIYLTEYVNELEIEADKLAEIGTDESQQEALRKYQQALLSDPNNKPLKDKLDKFKKKTGINTQPLMDFLLNFVTLPLKIIKKVIDFIMEWFKKLSSPFSLPSQIEEFTSFKWLLDIIKPDSILEMVGIKYDISQFYSWIDSIDTFSDDRKFDLNDVISMPFMPRLFSVNKQQLKELTKTPVNMLSSIVCLMDKIINSFIDYIWAMMGLEPIIPAPHVNFCKDMNRNIRPNDMADILNGVYNDNDRNSVSNGGTQSYDFVYDITLPDGSSLRSLNYEELSRWIEENGNIQIELEF